MSVVPVELSPVGGTFRAQEGEVASGFTFRGGSP